MRTKISSIFWIIVAVFFIYQGLQLYWKYSTPWMLWLIMLPETLAAKWIVFGVVSFIVGAGLIFQPQKFVGLVYSFPIWVLFLSLMGFVYELILYGSYFGCFDCIFDYFIFIPFLISNAAITKDKFFQDKPRLFDYYKKKWPIILMQSFAIFAVIQLIAWFVPYETFSFLHE